MDDDQQSDKENLAPSGVDVHYPPAPAPLPINSKGNIFQKHVAVETYYEQRHKPSNIARKRQRLGGTLTNSPPRASYASQMFKIFAPRPATRVEQTENFSPKGIPDDAMRVFEHFRQALKCRPSRETLSKGEDLLGEDSGEHSSEDGEAALGLKRRGSGSEQSTVPLLRREISASPSNAKRDRDDCIDFEVPTKSPASCTGEGVENYSPLIDLDSAPSPFQKRDSVTSHTDTGPVHPSREPIGSVFILPDFPNSDAAVMDPDPTHTANDLERAITASFPPTPTRSERRKTLNIDLRNTPPPATNICAGEKMDIDAPSSTDSWTGDELFFPRNHTQAPTSRPQSPYTRPPSTPTSTLFSQSPLRPPPSTSGSAVPPLFSPLRAVRPNRFHVPAVRSPMSQGVPLSMEDHPESVGSDADDEDEGSSGMSES